MLIPNVDLKNNMWINVNEIPGNNIDDDNNELLALFPKQSEGIILNDSIIEKHNEKWYYVEIYNHPIKDTHYWFYEEQDSTNISYIGWIKSSDIIIKKHSYMK